jgi:hypothetical protein
MSELKKTNIKELQKMREEQNKVSRGALKRRGENLNGVWAEFSTLKMGVFVYTLQQRS